jgi:hypothetical protein
MASRHDLYDVMVSHCCPSMLTDHSSFPYTASTLQAISPLTKNLRFVAPSWLRLLV